jgi:hypothetical protein
MQTLDDLRTGKLKGATRVALAAGLTQFPEEILDLAETLEILDLSGNALSTLPDDFTRLHRLRVLFMSNNRFERMPEVLGRCPNLSMLGFRANGMRELPAESLPSKLRWLILTDNALESLPAELGKRPALQKLMVAGNRLTTLPKELSACHNLQLLRIAANRFEVLPEWLLTLPRLSWLSYSGNPLCEALEAKALAQTPVPPVSWFALKLGPKLGEGASGVIYRAGLDAAAAGVIGVAESEVAVKLFKGALTSDGLPESEMAACMSAGAHPNLIQVLGKLSGHPQGTEGLVMSLVDPAYKNLAGPPSFETCTRDVYSDDLRFSVQDVLTIAKGVAGLAAQLHARGLMHGDLYAHNTLLGPDGHALIGDFGAASFVDVTDRKTAEALERLEVRAYGCLLEELLERVEGASAGADMKDCCLRLTALRDRCLQSNVHARPSFSEIEKQLSQL